MDGGAWWAAVHVVARSRTRLSDFTFTFHFHALEKEMATHSSVLAWRIPGMADPSGKLRGQPGLLVALGAPSLTLGLSPAPQLSYGTRDSVRLFQTPWTI